MTERWTDERLDRFADSVDRAIARHEEATTQAESERQELREMMLTTMQVLSESTQRQDDAIDALVVLTGRVTEQTAQLKQAVDYLMSKDGS